MKPEQKKQFANIPSYMRNLPNWIVFRFSKRGNKITKVPYKPRFPKDLAKTTVPGDWATFDEAVAACEKGNFDGIGFVLDDGAQMIGIDLDHCINGDGVVSDYAMSMVHDLDTYCEVSPSGTGLHLYCMGTFDGTGIKTEQVEIYCRGRYFTVTGEVFGEKRPLNTAADRVFETVSLLKADAPDDYDDQKEVSQTKDTKPSAQIEHIKDHQFSLAVDNKINVAGLIQRLLMKQQGEELWFKRSRTMMDRSQSSYDYMLAVVGYDLDFTDEEIHLLIWHHRKFHGEDYRKAERKDYIERTLRKARNYLDTQNTNRPGPIDYPVNKNSIDAPIEYDDSPEDYFNDLNKKKLIPVKNQWLIKDLLPREGVHYLVGPPGSKKSFVAIDIAHCVASGEDWFGHTVAQGQVFYLAGEGSSSLGLRVLGLEIGGRRTFADRQFLEPKVRVMIDDPESIQKLVAMIDKINEGVKLIVIDTKSASTYGDDSKTHEVEMLLRACRAVVERYNCSVLIVDHTPVADPTRLRGSGRQLGAADSAILIKKNKDDADLSHLTWIKDPKDQAPNKEGFSFRFKQIELPSEWDKEDGSKTTTLIPVMDDAAAPPNMLAQERELTESQVVVLRAIAQMEKEYRANKDHNNVSELIIPIEMGDLRVRLNEDFGSRSNVCKSLTKIIPRLIEFGFLYFDGPTLTLLKAGKEWLQDND